MVIYLFSRQNLSKRVSEVRDLQSQALQTS